MALEVQRFRESVKAFILCDGQALLQLRDQRPDIYFPGRWGLFGGGMDPGETMTAAVSRELEEELCYVFQNPEFLYSWKFEKFNSLIHYFVVYLSVGLEELSLTEGQDMRLFPLTHIRNLSLTPDLSLNLSNLIEIINC